MPRSSPRPCASSSRPKCSPASTIRGFGSARLSPRTVSASSSARSRLERRWCGARSVRSLGFWATRTRSRTTSMSCGDGRPTSTASSCGASARATRPRARSRIVWRPWPTSCGSRVLAISSATAEACSLVAVEAAAGLAAVVARAVTLLDAAWRAVLLATRRRVDRRTDHECEVDPGEIHEAERSERMAERLLRGEVDLLERGVALVDEEGRLAPERAEQPIRDEALDLLLHQDRPLADALCELDEERRCLRGGVRALHHLDHLHDHPWVEVVQVRDLRRTLGGARHQARHEGGGVGRKDRPRRAQSIELGEDLSLHREVLDDGLDRQVRIRRGLREVRREAQARPRRGRFFLCPAALLDAPCDVLVRPALRRPQLFRARVPESHGEPVLRRVQCDLAPHQACPDYEDPSQLVDLQPCLPAVSFTTRDPRSSSASARRSTLPTVLFGRLERNSISAGILKRASDEAQCVRRSSAVAGTPGRRTTNAFTTSPRSGSGTPIAAASSTAGCAYSASSTSRG